MFALVFASEYLHDVTVCAYPVRCTCAVVPPITVGDIPQDVTPPGPTFEACVLHSRMGWCRIRRRWTRLVESLRQTYCLMLCLASFSSWSYLLSFEDWSRGCDILCHVRYYPRAHLCTLVDSQRDPRGVDDVAVSVGGYFSEAAGATYFGVSYGMPTCRRLLLLRCALNTAFQQPPMSVLRHTHT